MTKIIQKWLRCQNGATAIEYSLIVAAISTAIVAAVFLLGDEMAIFFFDIADGLDGDVG